MNLPDFGNNKQYMARWFKEWVETQPADIRPTLQQIARAFEVLAEEEANELSPLFEEDISS